MRSCFTAAILVLAMAGTAQGYMKPYEIMPVRTNWSDWTPRDGWVAQTVTCCWDSVKEIHLFCGAKGDTNRYSMDIYDYETSQRVAYKHGVAPGRDHDWLKFTSISHEQGQKFERGREYIVKFTRPGLAC